MPAKSAKENERRSLLRTIVLIPAAALAGLAGGMIGENLSKPAKTVEPATYIVYQSGSTVYALNGTTANIDYSSSNLPSLITSLVNALSSGGLIYVKSGYYNLGSTTLSFPDTMAARLQFICEHGVVFAYSGSGDAVNIDSCELVEFRFGRILGQNSGNGIHVAPTNRNASVRYLGFTNNQLYCDSIYGFATCLNIDVGSVTNNVIALNDIYVKQIYCGNGFGSNFTSPFYGVAINGTGASGQKIYQNFITILQITPGNSDVFNGQTYTAILDGNSSLAALTYPQFNLWKVNAYGEGSGLTQILLDWYALYEQFQGALTVVGTGTAVKLESTAAMNEFYIGAVEASTLAELYVNNSTNYNRIHTAGNSDAAVLGWAITTPSFPATDTWYQNPYPFPITFHITGNQGNITAIYIKDSGGNSKEIATVAYQGVPYRLNPADCVYFTWSSTTPTWVWYGIPD